MNENGMNLNKSKAPDTWVIPAMTEDEAEIYVMGILPPEMLQEIREEEEAFTLKALYYKRPTQKETQ